MTNEEQKLREFVSKYVNDDNEPTFLYDLTALISENYVSKEEHDKVVQQRDELREALMDMVWQFAYVGTKDDKAVMYTGGLSALEGAFSALGLSDPITILDFEAAIKNTDG